MKKFVLAAALAAAFPAFAATVTVVDLADNTAFVDYSNDGLVSFDVSALNLNPMQLSITFSADDIAAGQVLFNAQVANPDGIGAEAFTLAFGGLNVTPGSAIGGFDGMSYSIATTAPASYRLARTDGLNEYYGVVIGDPFAAGTPQADWTVSTTGLTAGLAYTLEVSAVPEPAALTLLVGGLAALRRGQRRAKPVATGC